MAAGGTNGATSQNPADKIPTAGVSHVDFGWHQTGWSQRVSQGDSMGGLSLWSGPDGFSRWGTAGKIRLHFDFAAIHRESFATRAEENPRPDRAMGKPG